jgi:hypothetical protein
LRRQLCRRHAPNIYVVIVGRILQGAGAISAAVMALASDLRGRTSYQIDGDDRLHHRLGVRAVAGGGAWLNHLVVRAGHIRVDGLLALGAMFVVWPHRSPSGRHAVGANLQFVGDLKSVFARSATRAPELGHICTARRVDGAVSSLCRLRCARRHAAGGALEVYLPVMLASFVLMLRRGDGRARSTPPETLVCGVGRHCCWRCNWRCHGSPGGYGRSLCFYYYFLRHVNILESVATLSGIAHRAAAA